MGYHALYQSWKDDPEAFWLEAARAIDWDESYFASSFWF